VISLQVPGITAATVSVDVSAMRSILPIAT